MAVQANNRHYKKKNRNKMNSNSNSSKNDMLNFFFISLVCFLVTDFPVIKANNPAHKVSMVFTSISTMDNNNEERTSKADKYTFTEFGVSRAEDSIEVKILKYLDSQFNVFFH